MMNNDSIDINKNCFDIIRLICTFTVFLGHFITHFGIENSALHEIAYFVRGVPVFFFLSGLLIARSLDRYDIKTYAVKRVTRIFPELWVCVLLNLGIILIFYHGARTIKDIIVYLFTQLTVFQFYTGNWLRSYGVGTPNGALWTITVDIQFYIIALLVVRILRKKSIKVWISTIFVFLIINIVIAKMQDHMPDMVWKVMQCCIIPFFWIFLTGMMVYYYKDQIILLLMKLKWVIIVLYCVWQYVIPSGFRGLFEGVRYNAVTTILLMGLIVSIGFSVTVRLREDYSYSFYLYHMVIINFVLNTVLSGFNSMVTVYLAIIATMAVISIPAVLSHLLVGKKLSHVLEKRIMNRLSD